MSAIQDVEPYLVEALADHFGVRPAEVQKVIDRANRQKVEQGGTSVDATVKTDGGDSRIERR